MSVNASSSEVALGEARHIFVISRRRFIADALIDLLGSQPQVARCEIVIDASGLQAIETVSPASSLIDLDEPGLDLELISAKAPATGARRLGFYDTFTADHAANAFDLSITALFPLTVPVEHIVEAVLGNRRSTSFTEAEGLTRDELSRLSSLTEREVEVLQHLAAGRPVKAIAKLLGITTHTVDTHKRRIFRKLAVQHQAQAVALAVEAGMFPS
jgi:DNA-binding NarL/FixJ family response regulator